jgi:hypothetical protein
MIIITARNPFDCNSLLVRLTEVILIHLLWFTIIYICLPLYYEIKNYMISRLGSLSSYLNMMPGTWNIHISKNDVNKGMQQMSTRQSWGIFIDFKYKNP